MSIRARVLAFAIAAMVFVPAAAMAQTSPMSVGIKGGINLASLSFENDEGADLKRLIGGVGGVFIGHNVNENFGLQVEGLFSMRGVKFEVEEFGDEFSGKTKLTYIDVPVLARFGGSANGRRFFVLTGPQASFNLKAENVFDGETEDIDDVSTVDFGWVIGAGMDSGRFTVDARYTHGLKNIDSSGDDNAVKNRTFSVMVGVRLK